MSSIRICDDKQLTFDDLGKGTPIVFIHPPGMGRHVFYYQRRLSKHMRVILPDLSGHGDSSEADIQKLSVEYYSKEILSLLNEIGIERTVLCGYSAGGGMAQYISSHHPEYVCGLILIGGYPAVLNQSLKWEHKLGMYFVKNQRKLLTKGLAMSHTKNKELKKLLIDHMNKAETVAWCKFYEEVLYMNFIDDIKNIRVPILWMDGTKSDAINRYHTYYKRNEHDRVVLLKNVNHQLPTKRWRQVNEEILQYMNKLELI